MSAHRYWRLFVGSSSTGNYNYTAVGRLDFQDDTGASLCVGGTAYASTNYSSYYPAHAFPPFSGPWISGNERVCWIAYDFGAPVEPAQVAIMATAGGNYPLYMEVQYSDDNVTWTRGWICTKPDSWQLDATTWIYPNMSEGGDPAARYWLMHVETRFKDASGNPILIPEMRFLNASGNPIAGYSDPQGSDVGGTDWSAAWDGNPETVVLSSTVNGAGDISYPQFCHVVYPAAVAVYGMSILAGLHGAGDGAEWLNCPRSGTVCSSADGISWGRVWSFNDGNRQPVPAPGVGALLKWNTLAPPPASPPRRSGPLIG